MSISLSFLNVSKLLKSHLLVPSCFNCGGQADRLIMAYSQSAAPIVPTTEQHAVHEEEVRCIASAPNLQQNMRLCMT